MFRIRYSFLSLILLGSLVTHATWAAGTTPIKFGLTAVILQDRTTVLAAWKTYLEQRLGRPVTFVQRSSYKEITELLLTDELDAAWVCGFPYVRNKQRWKLMAVPLYRDKPLYQSYLIVPETDTHTRSYADLEGEVFAYSDPDSNSGYLVPQYEMLKLGVRSGSLFRKTFFTWAHQDVVRAVADGLSQGGAVDGYVWETLAKIDPVLTARTRVVAKSDWYGFPPIVARGSLTDEEFRAIQGVLLGMPDDPDGRRLLGQLNLDGFTPGEDSLFEGIERIVRLVDSQYAQASKL